ncbi:MAG: hydroxymethylbilane synthase [Flavobacteriales bacterium]
MSDRPLVIGTRGSKLALWQADHIEARLKSLGHSCKQSIIRTKGDQVQDLGFDKMEGKGFFTKEIENELLSGTIDLAVHSCKDLETRDPDGLHIAAIAGRAACEELLITNRDAVDATRPLELKEGAVVGTSSARRKSQLRMFRPDVRIEDLRGNVPTRVEKLRGGGYDAILLAKAGIDRLGLDLSMFHVRTLDPRVFIPAPAQGALAVQTRTADPQANNAAQELHDDRAALCVGLERAILFGYRGGCQVPLGVHATKQENGYSIWASAARTWDEVPRRVCLNGADGNALVAGMLQRLQAPIKPTRVFITRALSGDELMVRASAAHGITVIGAALFSPRAIEFIVPENFDRIFFTSRNAVRFFAQGGGRLDDAPCDAIGSGTAEELRRHGAEVAFVGDGPDTPRIARDYAERFSVQRVLFPCANEGQRTVQSALLAGNALDLHVYRMEPTGSIVVPDVDVAIITSPTNAEASHAVQPLDGFKHVIAMGTSTAQRIAELSSVQAIIPWASNEMALLDAVFEIATSP